MAVGPRPALARALLTGRSQPRTKAVLAATVDSLPPLILARAVRPSRATDRTQSRVTRSRRGERRGEEEERGASPSRRHMSALNRELGAFILRGEAIKLYRSFLRLARQAPEGSRGECFSASRRGKRACAAPTPPLSADAAPSLSLSHPPPPPPTNNPNRRAASRGPQGV